MKFQQKCHQVSLAIGASVLALVPLPTIADSGFYGSVRIGFGFLNNGDDTVLEFRNWGSRLGYGGESELSSDLSVFGKYELGVNTDSNDSASVAGILDDEITTRKAYVGVKGDFGSLRAGKDTHTFYNFVIKPVDKPWWGSCNGCVSPTGRTANGLTYAGEFFGIESGATLYLRDDTASADGEDNLDGLELGATFDDVVSHSIGVGLQYLADADDPTIGLTGSGEMFSVNYAAHLGINGSTFGIDVYAAYSDIYINFGFIDNDSDLRTDTQLGFTVGYSKELSENALAWFEAGISDSSAAGEDVNTALRAALKYDWK